jgi:hypothetical protein
MKKGGDDDYHRLDSANGTIYTYVAFTESSNESNVTM